MVDSSNKRLTVDIPKSEHIHLKMLCAQLGLSMREFVVKAIADELERFEDEADKCVVDESKRRIESGEDELVSWSEMETRLGWDEL